MIGLFQLRNSLKKLQPLTHLAKYLGRLWLKKSNMTEIPKDLLAQLAFLVRPLLYMLRVLAANLVGSAFLT